MTEVLTALKEVKEINKKTLEKLDLLKQLSVASTVRMGAGVITLDKGLTFKTIYADEATVTIATYPKVGCKSPTHCHNGLVEYLICIQGSTSVNFEHGYRILRVKDCVTVPEDTNHTVTALEDNSKLITICIPAEETFRASMECK